MSLIPLRYVVICFSPAGRHSDSTNYAGGLTIAAPSIYGIAPKISPHAGVSYPFLNNHSTILANWNLWELVVSLGFLNCNPTGFGEPQGIFAWRGCRACDWRWHPFRQLIDDLWMLCNIIISLTLRCSAIIVQLHWSAEILFHKLAEFKVPLSLLCQILSSSDHGLQHGEHFKLQFPLSVGQTRATKSWLNFSSFPQVSVYCECCYNSADDIRHNLSQGTLYDNIQLNDTMTCKKCNLPVQKPWSCPVRPYQVKIFVVDPDTLSARSGIQVGWSRGHAAGSIISCPVNICQGTLLQATRWMSPTACGTAQSFGSSGITCTKHQSLFWPTLHVYPGNYGHIREWIIIVCHSARKTRQTIVHYLIKATVNLPGCRHWLIFHWHWTELWYKNCAGWVTSAVASSLWLSPQIK